MTEIKLNVQIEEPAWSSALQSIEKTAEQVKDAVFSFVNKEYDLPILTCKLPININVCLSNDENVHELNMQFRGIDRPTNVLSFANMDFADFEAQQELYQEVELGDIIIAYETMQRESELEGISLQAHFCHLLAHGFLHLLGFDHMETEEAEEMEGLEIDILQSLGIENPYKEELAEDK